MEARALASVADGLGIERRRRFVGHLITDGDGARRRCDESGKPRSRSLLGHALTRRLFGARLAWSAILSRLPTVATIIAVELTRRPILALLALLPLSLATVLPGLAIAALLLRRTLGVGLGLIRLIGLGLIRLRLRLLLRLNALKRRSKTIERRAHLVVFILIGLRLANRALIAKLSLGLGLLRRGDETEIMLGVLEIALRHDRIAG